MVRYTSTRLPRGKVPLTRALGQAGMQLKKSGLSERASKAPRAYAIGAGHSAAAASATSDGHRSHASQQPQAAVRPAGRHPQATASNRQAMQAAGRQVPASERKRGQASSAFARTQVNRPMGATAGVNSDISRCGANPRAASPGPKPQAATAAQHAGLPTSRRPGSRARQRNKGTNRTRSAPERPKARKQKARRRNARGGEGRRTDPATEKQPSPQPRS